ncbi:di-heme oxidoreductase family protein [Thalassotalea sp. PLHSN55]|uniref:di-heme oxidoreductase family protein n=1 Tax=Thalassotalea sp. PLHSN55 TaxID=3435888 RepID=UPI003F839F81
MRLYSILLTTALLSACGGGGSGEDSTSTPTTPDPTTEPEQPSSTEHLAGGQASVINTTADAFSQRSGIMDDVDRIQLFELGDDFFTNPWVAGSASTSSRDGLGGLFNNNACQDCHIRDGRGHAPDEDSDDFGSILFRAAKSDITADQAYQMSQSLMANVGDTSVGGQLQQDAIADVMPEVDLAVTYTHSTVTFDDGYQVELRKPVWQLTSKKAAQGYDFDADTVFSARVSPGMTGLGLLALVSEQDILANEDINDSDNNGISGKANRVWSIVAENAELGRFGWKAGQPSLLEQSAGAFVNDMGLTSRLHQQESCLAHQTDCAQAANGNGDSVNDYDYEVSDKILEAIDFYATHLAVPQRRNAYDDDVKRGKDLFINLGCQGCHTASYTTEYSSEHPELSEQEIYPYTDMLLHDMGEELADFTLDNQPASAEMAYEFLATAREWRTPPLWGIGLAQTVDTEATFLHDGRARTILEAVLWHGGEAQTARDNVLKLSSSERADLLAFLSDL